MNVKSPPQVEPEASSTFCWGNFVPHVMHPVKVEIIEALSWIGTQPSHADLNQMLDAPGASQIAHHMRGLEDLGVCSTIVADDRQFNWEELVPDVIHPVKVAIVEAMSWIDRPLSPSELVQVLDRLYGLPIVAYHMRSLAEAGAVRRVEQRQVRGALQNLFVVELDGHLTNKGAASCGSNGSCSR